MALATPPAGPQEHRDAALATPPSVLQEHREAGGKCWRGGGWGGSDVRARAPDAGGRRCEGKMPVAVMAESSVSFRRLLEQCETQELEVRRGGRDVCVCR